MVSFEKTHGGDCMALIRCNECGGKISDSAKVCPHCGKEVDLEECIMDEAIKKSGREKKKIIVIVGAIILCIVVLCLLDNYISKKNELWRKQELYEMWEKIEADE